ncbi:MAG: nucleotidyltransferase family protein [Tenuifilum sp.]|uniref:nucleotidyltransferase family protein n=1 Tax=Tenuifilum TaxID=2760873 RepID=UPI001B659F9C|nr:nucleotidyltransferase family protein [Bacteroidales bacterium]HOK61388.1 nucleotidyltransferase family protein [Tenuifilum sp.]MBP9030270.1 nucleotidyltransferase family protein [Bacteroidales bacterium]HOK86172.1 nucleotidyltransferase family protein [Tenuifilum sp.]HON70808.1 nucleotidyltransferase family protein [Tenuifilum sp.]
MRAMILAAGLGTRLLPLTADKPKALIEVNGKTLLEICINNLIGFGFNHIVVNVHHHAQQIIDFLRNSSFNAQIDISDETERLLDTGGALVHARSFLDQGEPFLVHNVDIISNIDLHYLYQYHLNSSALASLAVSKREASRVFLFNEQMVLSGWRNMVTGKVIITNPSKALTAYAFSGIHVISPEIFKQLPPKGEFSIVDAYLKLSKEFLIQGADLSHSDVIDVGKPDTLELASQFVTRKV